MANDRWNDRDWRDDRSWQEGRGHGGRGGNFGRGGEGGRGYAAQGAPDADQRWRQMHQDRNHEGPAGYNPAGSNQGGWEFGADDQGGERGQGYERYGYGRGPSRPFNADEREYGRGGGYGAAGQGSQGSQTGGYAGQGGYGMSAEGGGYSSGPRTQQRGGERAQYAYGAHTPYGYRGSNEYDQRGRGGQYATDGGREDRSWLERAGDKVAGFFGAEDSGSHRGRGPKGYTRSDDRIREDISDRLTDDPWLDASDVEVEVAKCEVTLTGTVTSREDKRRAEDLAEAISGVKHVQNNIRVQDDRGTHTGAFDSMRTQPGQTAMGEQATDTTRNGRDQKGTRPQAPDAAPGLNT
jgi:osmotically-inducible protein OsmY